MMYTTGTGAVLPCSCGRTSAETSVIVRLYRSTSVIVRLYS
jgi:hypothetical protein